MGTGLDTWESPAFLRSSHGSLNGSVDSSYDLFAEADGFVPGKGRKRPRFSFADAKWRVVDEPDVSLPEETRTDWADTLDEDMDCPEDVDSRSEHCKQASEPQEDVHAPVSDAEHATIDEKFSEKHLDGENNKEDLVEASRSVFRVPETNQTSRPVPWNHLHLPLETPQLTPIPSQFLPTPSPLVTTSNSNTSYFMPFGKQARDTKSMFTEAEAHTRVLDGGVGKEQLSNGQLQGSEDSTEMHLTVVSADSEETSTEAKLPKKAIAELPESGNKKTENVMDEDADGVYQHETEANKEEELNYEEEGAQLKRDHWDHEYEFMQNSMDQDGSGLIVHSPWIPSVTRDGEGEYLEESAENVDRMDDTIIQASGEVQPYSREDDDGPQHESAAEVTVDDSESGSPTEQSEEEQAEHQSELYGEGQSEDGYAYDGEYWSEISSEDKSDSVASSVTSQPRQQASGTAQPDIIVLDSDSEEEVPPQTRNLRQDSVNPPRASESPQESDMAEYEESSFPEDEVASDDQVSEVERESDGSESQVEDEVKLVEVMEGEISEAQSGMEKSEMQEEEIESYTDNQSAIELDAGKQIESLSEKESVAETEPLRKHGSPVFEQAPSASESRVQSPNWKATSQGVESAIDPGLLEPLGQHSEEFYTGQQDQDTEHDEVMVIESSSDYAGRPDDSVLQLNNASSPPPQYSAGFSTGMSLHPSPRQEPTAAIVPQEVLACEVEAVGNEIRKDSSPARSVDSLGAELQLKMELMTESQLECPGIPTEQDTPGASIIGEESQNEADGGSEDRPFKFVPLVTLADHLYALVDTMSIIHLNFPIHEPSGPEKKDYFLTAQLTDPSMAGATLPVQISHPHKEALSLLAEGDAVLLRKFLVKSINGTMILVNVDASAWTVLKSDAEASAEDDTDAEERSYSAWLRRWYLEDGAARVADHKLQTSIEEPLREASQADSAAPSEREHDTPLSASGGTRKSTPRRIHMHELRDGTKYADPDKDSIHELRDGTVYVNP